jgi:hypothetical protein
VRESAEILAHDLVAYDYAIADDHLTILMVSLGLKRAEGSTWGELREQVHAFDPVRRVSQIAQIPKAEFEDYISFFERRQNLALALIEILSVLNKSRRE